MGARELDLSLDVADLTAVLCDIESVSGAEGPLADAVERAVRRLPHLVVIRTGDLVVARTDLGRRERVVLAGHLDTVPLAAEPNLPTRRVGEELWGRGTVDMKGGVAVELALAAGIPAPSRDVTYVWYDNEEVEASRNGLGRLARTRPELLGGDVAVLLEPTNAAVEGGCKGTLRVEVEVTGTAAHSGRPWAGDNAIHKSGAVLDVLRAHEARVVEVDGLTYHEGLSAVDIAGGTAGNVIPDRCVVVVNYRFAPDLDAQEAVAYVSGLFAPWRVAVTDLAGGARPGLHLPTVADFVAHVNRPVTAKEGWTDVARFAALGVPAVNFGPGDPMLAHRDDERCPLWQYRTVHEALAGWLSS